MSVGNPEESNIVEGDKLSALSRKQTRLGKVAPMDASGEIHTDTVTDLENKLQWFVPNRNWTPVIR